MRRSIVATFAVVVGLGIVLGAVPFLTKQRTQVAVTPQPSPLDWIVTLPLSSGQEACMERVAVDERSEIARIQVGTNGRRGQPLRLRLTGNGYRADASIAGGYLDSATLSVPIRPPRRATEATVCLANRGRRRVWPIASADRTRSRLAVSVDGAPRAAAFTLTFVESRRASLLDRMPLMLARMETFRPRIVGPWLLWPLAAAFVAALLLAVPWALVRAARDDR